MFICPSGMYTRFGRSVVAIDQICDTELHNQILIIAYWLYAFGQKTTALDIRLVLHRIDY